MENEKKQIKKEEECPLCKISLETLEALKKTGEQKIENKLKAEEKSKDKNN